MPLDYTPTTELEAVNEMLSILGEQPVNTLDSTGITTVSIAQDILHRVSRSIQAKKLRCNSEDNYTLIRSADGTVLIPRNTLSIDGMSKSDDFIQRGTKLYNRKDHTFIFTADPQVTITFFLEFEQLPEAVRKYITIKASRIFQRRMLTSDTVDKMTDQEEAEAYLDVVREEIDTGNYTIFDSRSTSEVINR